MYTYLISNHLIKHFAEEALKNKASTNGHNESLAIIVGHTEGNKIFADELIFPAQTGTSSDVEDLGKFKNLLMIVSLKY